MIFSSAVEEGGVYETPPSVERGCPSSWAASHSVQQGLLASDINTTPEVQERRIAAS